MRVPIAFALGAALVSSCHGVEIPPIRALYRLSGCVVASEPPQSVAGPCQLSETMTLDSAGFSLYEDGSGFWAETRTDRQPGSEPVVTSSRMPFRYWYVGNDLVISVTMGQSGTAGAQWGFELKCQPDQTFYHTMNERAQPGSGQVISTIFTAS
ncbi:MAG TPA: hypothetical protein VEB19_04650 [Gemmatimonadaceae bacterium]|nr:hypothetical protein [Gemmatimonadaceae bacterium]